MGILAEDIARVRAATDFVAVAGEHLALKRVGRRWVGLCPFHGEKTPSFSVNAEEGLYHCFGCGVGGDVITFVREIEHLDFAEAVERLAAKAGIQLRYDDAAVSGERKRRATLVEAMARAVDWYHERLLSAPDAAAARAYLRSERGYDGEVVRTYRLGWAPDSWDALVRSLRLPHDVLRDTGLGRQYENRWQDEFRARLLFPIFDVRGDPIGFGGRSLPGGRPPKYRNSPETPLYRKARELYGLNWAKRAIVEEGQVVVCEGYTDVIGLHRAGVATAVASCGTALGDDHVRVLENFARRLVLAYDADAAGQGAAERVYEWEQRHDLDVAVAAFPPGEDPADLAHRDPDALRDAIAGARPFLGFRLDRALAAADLRTPEGRARAAEAALAVVGEHPSAVVRDQYLMEVADRLRLSAERLRELAAMPRRPAPGRPGRGAPGGRETRPPAPPARAARPLDRIPRREVEALRVAIHRPEEVADLLHEVLFSDPVAIDAYGALATASTLHDAIERAQAAGERGAAAAALIQRLAVEDDRGEDARDVVGWLAEAAGGRALAALQAEWRAAGGEGLPEHEAAVIAWLKPTVEELVDPATRPDATDRLVRWLVERSADLGAAGPDS